MADITPFLNLERKEDSPTKVQKISGKPTKWFWRAFEFNRIVDRINTLRNMLYGLTGNILQAIAGKVVDLGEIPETANSVVDYINGLAGGILLGESVSAYVECKINGLRFVYGYVGQPITYGANNETITTDDLELLYDESQSIASLFKYANAFLSMTSSEAGGAPGTFNLFGNIGTTAFIIRLMPGYYKIIADAPVFTAGKTIVIPSQSEYCRVAAAWKSETEIVIATTNPLTNVRADIAFTDGINLDIKVFN